ncbi:MAG TPA: hypothetical protein VIG64_04180 [Actinomycetota bacterium]
MTKLRDMAGSLVQPGETVKHAVPVLAGSLLWAAFGALGALFAQPRIIVTTESNLYVVKRGKPDTVEERHSLASTDVTARKGFPIGRMRIGDKTFWVGLGVQQAAVDLAADAKT